MKWLSPGLVELRTDFNARDDNNWVRVPAAVIAGWAALGDRVLVTDEDGEVGGQATVQVIDEVTGVGFLAIAWDTIRRVAGADFTTWPCSIPVGERLRRAVTVSETWSGSEQRLSMNSTSDAVGLRQEASTGGGEPPVTGGLPMTFKLEASR